MGRRRSSAPSSLHFWPSAHASARKPCASFRAAQIIATNLRPRAPANARDTQQISGVGQTIGELQQLSDSVQSLADNANGLGQSLGSTFTMPDGVTVPRAEELYRKFGAIQQSSRNFQTVTGDVLARREALRQQIAATTQQLQSATTDAETQKLTGVLVGYNAELEAVDREIDQAAAQVATQDIENRNDQERQEEARREERRAQLEEGFRRSSTTSISR